VSVVARPLRLGFCEERGGTGQCAIVGAPNALRGGVRRVGRHQERAVRGARHGGGNVRTMCGSRTGGWSLPCVMSD
jgi:hypothetical protein